MSVRKKPLVVVTRKLPESIETRMRELFDARLNLDDLPMSPENLADAMRMADVLVPTVSDEITEQIINQPDVKVKLIAHFGNGVDNIDIDAAHKRGITVTNTPKVLTEDTADMTMALILAVPRRLIEGSQVLTEGREDWQGWAPMWMLGHRIGGKRLGIIGMGRIGQAVARRALGFGMQVHYHNRHRLHAEIEGELEATWWESLDQMLAHMDLVSINCPQTPETYHLLDARRLDLLPRHAVIVNTARGGIIDESALADRLADRIIAGAGLDVYEAEPRIHARLLALDNVVLAPHLGSATYEGRVAMGEKVVINIKAYADGHTPPDRVLVGIDV
jgi:glyoxylate reductase